MMTEKYYIIEFGGEKEQEEMSALELDNVEQARAWIQDAMVSDSEYFDININCNINVINDKQALVCAQYESIVTDEMIESEIYAPEIIITSNLSIVSKIIKKLEVKK